MSAAKQKQMMRGNGNLMMMNNNMQGFKPNSNMNISNNNQMQSQANMGNAQQQQQQQTPQNNAVAPFLTPSMDDLLSGAGEADIAAWDPSLESLAQNGDAANLLGDGTNLDPDHFLGGNDNHHALGGPGGGGGGAGDMTNNIGGPGMPPMSPSFVAGGPNSNVGLQGVKIPDENLTPQQRQHREEQLATLRRMQKMFFPEHGQMGPDCQQQMNQMAMGQGPDSCMKMGGMPPGANMMGGGGPNMGGPMMNPMNCGPGGQMNQIRGMNPMFRQQMGNNMMAGGGMGGPNMMEGHPGMGGGMNDMNCGMGGMETASMIGHMSGGTMVMGMNKPPNMPPNMQGPMPQGMQAQMEWNKMQQQQQQQAQQGQQPPGGFNKKMGGPPPPYQGRSSSVPLTGNLQSPNPGSPSNPLSLPAASPRNLPHQSPSHGSPAVHRMNQSNPSTPLSGSAHMSPAPASMKDPSESNAVNNEGEFCCYCCCHYCFRCFLLKLTL